MADQERRSKQDVPRPDDSIHWGSIADEPDVAAHGSPIGQPERGASGADLEATGESNDTDVESHLWTGSGQHDAAVLRAGRQWLDASDPSADHYRRGGEPTSSKNADGETDLASGDAEDAEAGDVTAHAAPQRQLRRSLPHDTEGAQDPEDRAGAEPWVRTP